MPKFKPTPAEWKLIREITAKASPSLPSTRHIEMLGRSHYLLEGDRPRDHHINGALLSKVGLEGFYGDLDVADKASFYTDEFRKGSDLTEDGRGYYDFYIYNRYDPDHELIGNVMVYVSGGKMIGIETILDGREPYFWSPETGIAVGSFRQHSKAKAV